MPRQTKRALAWTLSATMPLFASCTAATTGSRDCTFARVITVSPDDMITPQTARMILAHNRATEAVCGRGAAPLPAKG